jgi:hypothetical protein
VGPGSTCSTEDLNTVIAEARPSGAFRVASAGRLRSLPPASHFRGTVRSLATDRVGLQRKVTTIHYKLRAVIKLDSAQARKRTPYAISAGSGESAKQIAPPLLRHVMIECRITGRSNRCSTKARIS